VPDDEIEVSLTNDDINYFLHQAKIYWMDTNTECRLPGSPMQMTETQFRVVAWIRAATDVLSRRELTKSKPVFVLDVADHAPDTEDI
jgi:hypothetical protein